MLEPDGLAHDGVCGLCGERTKIRKFRQVWSGPICNKCAATTAAADNDPDISVQNRAETQFPTKSKPGRREAITCFFCGDRSFDNASVQKISLCQVIRVEGSDTKQKVATALGGAIGAMTTKGKTTAVYRKRSIEVPRCERCKAAHDARDRHWSRVLGPCVLSGAGLGICAAIALFMYESSKRVIGTKEFLPLLVTGCLCGVLLGGMLGLAIGTVFGFATRPPLPHRVKPAEHGNTFDAVQRMRSRGWTIGLTPPDHTSSVELPPEEEIKLPPEQRGEWDDKNNESTEGSGSASETQTETLCGKHDPHESLSQATQQKRSSNSAQYALICVVVFVIGGLIAHFSKSPPKRPNEQAVTQRSAARAAASSQRRARAVAPPPTTTTQANPKTQTSAVWHVDAWVSYEDPMGRFSCQYPSGWQVQKDDRGVYWRTAFVSPRRHTLQIKIRKQGVPATTPQQLDEAEQRFLSAPLREAERVLYDQPTEFAGLKARSYGAWTKVDQEPATQLVVQFLCGGLPHAISLTSLRENTVSLDPAETLLQNFLDRVELKSCVPSGLHGMFTDQHGFFTFVPPTGWLARTYPDDVRGKVLFAHPDSGATLNILVKVSEVEPNTVDAVMNNLRANLQSLGIQPQLERIKLPFGEAVKGTYSFKGEKFLTIACPIEDMYHDFMFSASPGAFPASLQVAMESIKSYEPVTSALTDPMKKEHLVQSLRKQAESLKALGDRARALRRVEAALKLAPNDASLQKLFEDLKGNR